MTTFLEGGDLKTDCTGKQTNTQNKNQADLPGTQGTLSGLKSPKSPHVLEKGMAGGGGVPPGRKLAGQSSGSGAFGLDLKHSLVCSSNSLNAVSVAKDSLPHLEGKRLQVQ